MEPILPKLQQFIKVGRPDTYHYSYVENENNNYSTNNYNLNDFKSNKNNNHKNNNTDTDDNDNTECDTINVSQETSLSSGLKLWQNITRNIIGVNCLYNQAKKRCGFVPIVSEVELAEVGLVRVAMVSMGEHLGLLNNWYSLPDTYSQGNQIPVDSILFPLSTYLLSALKKIKQELHEVGDWWHGLEMRKLRLRHNIKALYLYDTYTDEQMILYRTGLVTLHDMYTHTCTVQKRVEVWIL